MKQFSYAIQDELGIHARPAGLLVKKAAAFQSDIKITFGEKSADCKRLFAVMGLGVKQGNTIEFTIEGADEEAAAQALEAFMKETL